MTYPTNNNSLKERQQRTEKVLIILKKTYPQAKIALKYSNSWELLVAVVLSAQCTDKKVNEVTAKLFPKAQSSKRKAQNQNAKFKTITNELHEIMYFAQVELEELEKDIKSTGFYKNKAKNLKNTAKIILENYGGEIPRTMEELVKLPGIARKTANIILGNAFGIVEGIAVDTHVHRISQRLRLVDMETIRGGKKKMNFEKNGRRILDYKKDAVPERIERELIKVVPKKEWFKFTYLLIDHGRAICTARDPDCQKCPLKQLCPVTRG